MQHDGRGLFSFELRFPALVADALGNEKSNSKVIVVVQFFFFILFLITIFRKAQRI